MEEQKIVHTDDINWYEEDENRLDYDLAFNGDGYKNVGSKKSKSSKEESKVDVKNLIQKRDKKWKKRLAKAREEAFKKGRQQGYEDGFSEAEQQVDDKLHRLEALVAEAHSDWEKRHQQLNPGLLDLVFDIAEKIVGLPVENPAIREKLEEELSGLLHETEDEIKPQLWLSKQDYNFVEDLVKKYAPELSISIRISEACNPGEFEFETKKETVVHRFKEKLRDLRENITLPSWK